MESSRQAGNRAGPAGDPPSTRRARLPRSQREQLILDVAAQLFYARGIRAVGMDELITTAGLAKMTVYRIFPTKDSLVAGYLRRLQGQILDAIDQDIAENVDDPAAALTAILDAVALDLSRPGFRGCPFGNAAVDYANPSDAARSIAREYREQLRGRLQLLSERVTGTPELGDQIAVLIDGVYLSAAHLGPDGPARTGLKLARELIRRDGRPVARCE